MIIHGIGHFQRNVGSQRSHWIKKTRRHLSPVGSSHITDALRECGFELPPNFGRHLAQQQLAGLSRVEKNKVSRHGSIFLSSNNAGINLSPIANSLANSLNATLKLSADNWRRCNDYIGATLRNELL